MIVDAATTEDLRTLLIHGVGGRSDLPIPVQTAQYAAIAVLAATFLLLASKWSEPRFESSEGGRSMPTLQRVVDSSTFPWLGRLLGLAGLATFMWFAAVGPSDSAANPAPTWLYVWVWVGLILLSALVGPVVTWLNPFRAVTAAFGRFGGDRQSYPEKLGYWPAAIALLVFVWMELVKDDGDLPSTVLGFVVLYAAVQIIGGTVYGEEWHDKADGFDVYSRFVALLSPFRRDAAGRLEFGSPLTHLPRFPDAPGAIWVVYVLLGSTAFDGLTRTQFWADVSDVETSLMRDLVGTLGLLACITVVTVAFRAACWLTTSAPARSADRNASAVEAAFAHTLVPIVLGYAVAHYFSLLMFQGQAGYLFAFDNMAIDYSVVSAALIGWVQVSAILVGHVIGVVAAHDRAVGMFRPEQKRVGQYPILACMVAFTFAGIGLLLGA